jgi:CRP-like cAMP-binding protein
MAIEKCINEYGVDDVIFEEGSTGRELFVVLDGQVEVAKIDGPNKTVIVTLGKGEFFGEMAVIDGSARSHHAVRPGQGPAVRRRHLDARRRRAASPTTSSRWNASRGSTPHSCCPDMAASRIRRRTM